jgi:hypothetical protein
MILVFGYSYNYFSLFSIIDIFAMRRPWQGLGVP